MHFLIRNVNRRAKGAVNHEDKPYQGESLGIGRGADRAILVSDLRVALNHAKIVAIPDQGFLVQSESTSGLRVNGHLVQGSRLSVGDQIEVGNTRIEVISPPEGFDFAVQVETIDGADESISPVAKAKMDFSATGRSKRIWSWVLFLGIFIGFFAIPLAGVVYEPLRGPLRATVPAISDEAWDSGPLANAHHAFGTDCNRCHQLPFRMVRDGACVDCHAKTAQHADPQFYDLKMLVGTRCATCHKEHNGLHALQRHDEGLCADCHTDLKQEAPTTELRDAADFGKKHPDFDVTLVTNKGDGDVVTRVPLSQKGLKEDSGLTFPHDEHLKEEGIRAPFGTVKMTCGDCHQADKAGEGFKPINMEAHCLRCHELRFDEDTTRQVPHRKVDEVIHILETYYSSVALEGGYDDFDAPDVVREKRRPGRELTEEERKDAVEWVEKKWREAAEVLFEFSTCKTCHQVTKTYEEPPRWEVRPVRIADQWMPKARFNHARHATMECESCHKAEESKESSDVMIPDIENCRKCHGGEHAKRKLQSVCMDCHGFHIFQDIEMSDRDTDIEE